MKEVYQGSSKLWSVVCVPKLIYQPKWFKNDKDLNDGDLVHFQKEPDNNLSSKWIMGTVDQVIRSKDRHIWRVINKYQNHNEEEIREDSLLTCH